MMVVGVTPSQDDFGVAGNKKKKQLDKRLPLWMLRFLHYASCQRRYNGVSCKDLIAGVETLTSHLENCRKGVMGDCFFICTAPQRHHFRGVPDYYGKTNRTSSCQSDLMIDEVQMQIEMLQRAKQG